jgi:hypothetical protein
MNILELGELKEPIRLFTDTLSLNTIGTREYLKQGCTHIRVDNEVYKGFVSDGQVYVQGFEGKFYLELKVCKFTFVREGLHCSCKHQDPGIIIEHIYGGMRYCTNSDLKCPYLKRYKTLIDDNDPIIK